MGKPVLLKLIVRRCTFHCQLENIWITSAASDLIGSGHAHLNGTLRSTVLWPLKKLGTFSALTSLVLLMIRNRFLHVHCAHTHSSYSKLFVL